MPDCLTLPVIGQLAVRPEFMRMNPLLPLGSLLALLTVGCGGTKESQENLLIQENIPLTASDAEAPEWIGIAEAKEQGEQALFQKVLPLRRPFPSGGSIGIYLQRRMGAPLPSVLVYRGTNRWAEENAFVGEFRVTEWPRPDENALLARVGFQITEQQSLLMWLRDPGPDREGVANVDRSTPIPIERVEPEMTEPTNPLNDGPARSAGNSDGPDKGPHR